jgi:hypothetical protein
MNHFNRGRGEERIYGTKPEFPLCAIPVLVSKALTVVIRLITSVM